MDGRMAGQMAGQTDGCREGWTDGRRAGWLASAAMEGWTARRMQGRTDRWTGRQVSGGLGRQMGAQRAGRMGRQTGGQLAGCWPLGERRCRRPGGPGGLILHRRDPGAWRGSSCWGHPTPVMDVPPAPGGCATHPAHGHLLSHGSRAWAGGCRSAQACGHPEVSDSSHVSLEQVAPGQRVLWAVSAGQRGRAAAPAVPARWAAAPGWAGGESSEPAQHQQDAAARL